MNISTDGMIAAIRSAAERVEPRESEMLNSIADRIAELVALISSITLRLLE